MSDSHHILRSGRLTLDCRRPVEGGAHLMGVLNITPDSFSDGGRYMDPDLALERARDMVREGAALIDIGGASSRPKGTTYGVGAALIDAQEEKERILPVIKRVAEALPDVWISVDTFRADVAEEALAAGAHAINDITALRFDPDIAQVVAARDVPLILMHSVGMPGEMPHAKISPDIMTDVQSDLDRAVSVARLAGCRQLVLDPGFGFGKIPTDNVALIAKTAELVSLGFPVLLGVSRKSTIAQIAPNADGELPSPEKRLPGSLALTGVGVAGGATIVRTHDVWQTSQYLRVLDATIRVTAGQKGSNEDVQ
ncbi:MAG: dihydropteroate synthase [Bacteroidetes bacterium]|nr:dihydropteroate synthase [Bacteroidota bacterium]MDA1333301.1 dihydropteroate synthase [Bacteroidota bacterium]